MPVQLAVTRNVPYSSDSINPKLQLDLYVNTSDTNTTRSTASTLQPSKPQLPLLIYIHGGLWADGDKNAHCNIALTLAKRCQAHVAVINYRLLKTDKVHWPVYIHDVIHALVWLQQAENRKTYQFDVSTTMLVGHSVGATMASLIAVTTDVRPDDVSSDAMRQLRASIDGIVCLQGMYNLSAYVQRYADWASAVTDPLGTKDTSTWQEPHRYLTQLAEMDNGSSADTTDSHLRWLILHSPDDEWVNTEQSTEFTEQLKAVYGADAVESHTDITGGHHDVVKNIGLTNDKITDLITKFVLSVVRPS